MTLSSLTIEAVEEVPDADRGRSVAWARPGYSPDFVGVSLHFCVLDLALRIRTAWEPV